MCWFTTPSPHHPGMSGNGVHAVASAVPYVHETADTTPVQFSQTLQVQSNPSSWVSQYVIVDLCRTTLDDVNTVLFQHAADLLNIIHIHAGNADTTFDLAVTVLNNFKLKRDAVQTKNDLPAQ